MNKTDLIIIGSGPGGYRAAEYAAKKGLHVIIIEAKNAGGTCLNEGCIPTKTFCRNAEIIDTLRESEIYGLDNLKYDLNFSQIAQRKQKVVEQLRTGVESLLSSTNITFVRGFAKFKDSKTILVGEDEYNADNIIIATGSHSKMPPIKGIDLPNVITSTELLDVKTLPKHLCIIGAGVIGMEFASAFSSFGTKVTVIEFLKECLPTLDSDIAKRLRKILEKRGVEFHLQSGVKEITSTNVIFERKGKTEQVEADLVLVATGRGANTDGLGLDDAGIIYDKKGITVDDNLKTNIDNIFAIGDVNGKCMLAHAATFQGIHVINHILNIKDCINLNIIPSAIFTNPEAASVGLTEDQCEQQNIEFTCKKGYYRSNGKALAMNETEGLVKLLCDKEHKIIGCHIYGAHASDMVQEIASLMNMNCKIENLKDAVHTHPTLSEILQVTAEQF